MDAAKGTLQALHKEQLPHQLTWLVVLRLILISVLAGTTLIVHLRGETGILGPVIFVIWWLIVASAVASFIFHVLRNVITESRLHWLAICQILWDIFFSTGLVYVTGSLESIFTPLYFVNIAMGAIILGRRFGYFSALLCTFFYSLLLALGYHNMIPSILDLGIDPEHRSAPTKILSSIFLNTGLFFMVAYLIGQASAKLRVAEASVQQGNRMLLELENLHSSILDSLPTGVITIDKSGVVINANHAACELFGIDSSIIHLPLSTFLPQIANRALGDRPEWASGEGYVERWQMPFYNAKLQQELYLSIALSGFMEDNRILTVQDLTLYHAMETQLKRQDRLATVGKLSAAIAHEIRNPLASISGSIEMLHAESQLPENKRLMDIVLRETQRLNGMISDFLEFAKPAAPVMSWFRVGELIDETLTLFRHQHANVHMVAEHRGDYTAYGDASQIRQVLWNLLKNASEATPEAGEIFVRSDFDTASGRVCIEVVDAGKGIPTEIRERIFDPFFTTKPKGSGLGLPTVAKIITAHGGEIKLTTGQGGKGTAIAIYLTGKRAA